MCRTCNLASYCVGREPESLFSFYPFFIITPIRYYILFYSYSSSYLNFSLDTLYIRLYVYLYIPFPYYPRYIISSTPALRCRAKGLGSRPSNTSFSLLASLFAYNSESSLLLSRLSTPSLPRAGLFINCRCLPYMRSSGSSQERNLHHLAAGPAAA